MSSDRATFDEWASALDVGRVPVPEHLAERVRCTPSAAWASTRDRYIAPYALLDHLDEIDPPDWPDDYLVLALDGHGAASRAIHFYVVADPVAVFVQSRWGTAYEEPEVERERFARRVRSVDRLLGATDAVAPGHRLLVVASDFRGEWAELWHGGDQVWRSGSGAADAFDAALERLASQHRG